MPQDLRSYTATGQRHRRRYEEIARGIHRAARALSGDRYATIDEMHSILSDPLAYYEQIEDAFVAETGRYIRCGCAFIASADEIAEAKRRHREAVTYCERRNHDGQLVASVPQQAQQQQADAGRRYFLRTALAAGLLAAAVTVTSDSEAAPAVTANVRSDLRGDSTARLPGHAELWARMPLPFTPAEAWHLLSPATQAEIGAAVIGMVLAEYVSGDMHGDADRFYDDALCGDAMDTGSDLLTRIEQRLWVLFPDLYGPDGDHPAWALNSGMAPPAT
ncbi:hypothetical protein MKK63_11905 [Methylobacterium sp. J-088]|uniref:hypothetical protein n=1 Tax=Methylobacterium sp. J-088 TaxID=2836664 RepID=UPI001FB93E1A|nr:hypothetical protein [Methylobacterium sp. J-088]MCJ2063411.1 hypothetical protein [Methylobacterium sp. J-088]